MRRTSARSAVSSQELSGERHALVNTSDRVSESLHTPRQRDPDADREAVRPAGEARQGHRRCRREPHHAGNLARHQRRQPRDRRRRAHRAAAERARKLHRRPSVSRSARRAEQMQITFDRSAAAARHLAWQSHREPADRLRGIRTRARRRARQPRPGARLSAVERTRSLDEAFGERLRLFDEFDHALDLRHRHRRRRQDRRRSPTRSTRMPSASARPSASRRPTSTKR